MSMKSRIYSNAISSSVCTILVCWFLKKTYPNFPGWGYLLVLLSYLTLLFFAESVNVSMKIQNAGGVKPEVEDLTVLTHLLGQMSVTGLVYIFAVLTDYFFPSVNYPLAFIVALLVYNGFQLSSIKEKKNAQGS